MIGMFMSPRHDKHSIITAFYESVYLLFHYKGEISPGLECVIQLNEVYVI